MEARRNALESFYGGAVWGAHRTAANDTMADSSNVLLLKPARAGSGFEMDLRQQHSMVTATICHFGGPVNEGFLDLFENRIAPEAKSAGATLLGSFVTEPAANTFPRLPVREGEHVFVWVAAFTDDHLYANFRSAFGETAASFRERLSMAPEILELTPTERSLLGRGRL